MRDLAREVGISVSAISLALRNSPKVSKERREQVHSIAKKFGYIKDGRVTELMEHIREYRKASSLATIGVIVPDVSRSSLRNFPRIQSLISGVKEEAQTHGYGVDLLYLKDMGVSPTRLRNILFSRGIRGVVVMPSHKGVAELELDFSGLCISTAGYSIIDPVLNRACPHYLQMMDELLEQLCELGYQRIGFIMTYPTGGIGHKLYSSSYLYYSTLIPESLRIPILPRRDIGIEGIKKWMEKHKPEVVISSGKIYRTLESIGYRIPDDLGFASLELFEDHKEASGVDQRHKLVGREALKLSLSDINLNNAGIPKNPKVVLVDSHFKKGNTLRKVGRARAVKLRTTKR